MKKNIDEVLKISDLSVSYFHLRKVDEFILNSGILMIKQLLNFLVLFILLTTPIHAQSLEIVFKDSIWGAGIGGAIGLASWALTEEHMSTDLRNRIIRGSAFGALFGVGFGLFEANNGFSENILQKGKENYFVEWSRKRNVITLDPISIMNLGILGSKKKGSLRLMRYKF